MRRCSSSSVPRCCRQCQRNNNVVRRQSGECCFARGSARIRSRLLPHALGRPSFFLATPYPLSLSLSRPPPCVCVVPFLRRVYDTRAAFPRFYVPAAERCRGYVIVRADSSFSRLRAIVREHDSPRPTRVFCRWDFSLSITRAAGPRVRGRCSVLMILMMICTAKLISHSQKRRDSSQPPDSISRTSVRLIPVFARVVTAPDGNSPQPAFSSLGEKK